MTTAYTNNFKSNQILESLNKNVAKNEYEYYISDSINIYTYSSNKMTERLIPKKYIDLLIFI